MRFVKTKRISALVVLLSVIGLTIFRQVINSSPRARRFCQANELFAAHFAARKPHHPVRTWTERSLVAPSLLFNSYYYLLLEIANKMDNQPRD